MYGDSSEEEDKQEEPLPPYVIRSSDMKESLQIKCVRSKLSFALFFYYAILRFYVGNEEVNASNDNLLAPKC